MKGTKFILATIVVIGATVNFGVQGFPKPQGNSENEERTIVDGFAFDGPADRAQPSRRPPTRPPTPTDAPTLPTRPPVVGPTVPTQPPVVAPTIPTQPPVVAPTPVPSTVSPDVARCAQNCQFQVTPEYNPVCGSDGNMYSNNGLLNCVRNCGANISLSHIGRCTSNPRG